MDEMLKVEDLCINFGGVIAADHVSLDVAPGEIVGLIGPNGAGKTTVLNLISGLLPATNGRVTLNGEDISKQPSYVRARKGIARTYQTPHMLKGATIKDNLMVGADLADGIGFLPSVFGKKGRDIRPEVDKYLEMAGFQLDWDTDIGSLPYGQQKMLEIIRSLLTKPKIILVDEPAAGLNGKELEHSVKMLKYAATQMGVGVLLIEHNMGMVMSVCSKIVVLNFGKVIATGTPEEVSKNEAVIEAYLGRDENAGN